MRQQITLVGTGDDDQTAVLAVDRLHRGPARQRARRGQHTHHRSRRRPSTRVDSVRPPQPAPKWTHKKHRKYLPCTHNVVGGPERKVVQVLVQRMARRQRAHIGRLVDQHCPKSHPSPHTPRSQRGPGVTTPAVPQELTRLTTATAGANTVNSGQACHVLVCTDLTSGPQNSRAYRTTSGLQPGAHDRLPRSAPTTMTYASKHP